MSNAISRSKRNQVLISEHFYHSNQGLFLWGRACSTEIQWHWVLAQLPGALQGPILLHGEGIVLLWATSWGSRFPTFRAGLRDPFQPGMFCDVWPNQHITPLHSCVQWCIWDKSSSRSSLYHSLHSTLCFSICYIQASQKVASAHSGWWRLREPRGLHSHASSVTKQGLRSLSLVLRVGSHSCCSPEQRAGSKALKRPKGAVGIFTHSMASKNSPRSVRRGKAARRQRRARKGLRFGCSTESRTAWEQPGWSPSPQNAPAHTHSALRPGAPGLPLSHKASFKTALLSLWDALGMGCTHNSP